MSTGAKKALRKSIKSKLTTLSHSDLSRQSQQAQQQIFSLAEYTRADRISVYLSMPKAEAQTDALIRDAFAAGKQVFVPYIHRPQVREGEPKKRSIVEMLRLESVREYEGLERDSWGIPSLPSEGLGVRENAMGGKGAEGIKCDTEGSLDLVVVPGVAFDSQMNRLGHGAGFYDEFLTRHYAEGMRKKPFLGNRPSFIRLCNALLTRNSRSVSC